MKRPLDFLSMCSLVCLILKLSHIVRTQEMYFKTTDKKCWLRVATCPSFVIGVKTAGTRPCNLKLLICNKSQTK